MTKHMETKDCSEAEHLLYHTGDFGSTFKTTQSVSLDIYRSSESPMSCKNIGNSGPYVNQHTTFDQISPTLCHINKT